MGSGSGTSTSGSSGGGTPASSDPETQRRLLREVQRRTDLVSYSLLAEINQFHRDHVLCQMSGHVRQLLRNQIEFHRKVSGLYYDHITFVIGIMKALKLIANHIILFSKSMVFFILVLSTNQKLLINNQ